MYSKQNQIDTGRVWQGFKKTVTADYPYPLEWDEDILFPLFCKCHSGLIEEHSHIDNSYYSDASGNGLLRMEYLDHYVILCYRYAQSCYRNGRADIADAVYYSSRVRGGIDLYYKTEIGPYFMPVHALGTVVDSHAEYGCLFRLYNCVHIGPYSIEGKPGERIHPCFGDYVTVLGGAKIFGRAKVGNNVMISANTIIINEEIPDNCVVSGISPNLYYMPLRTLNSTLLRQHDE